MPIHVWKSIKRIQREFLWGGKGGRKRINWVKWDIVCLPKSQGGLGVRDVRAVNISLLSKWRWRLLGTENALWKEVIRGKYGDEAIGRVNLGDESKPWFSSSWWKDICSIGMNQNHDWFSQQVVKVMGNGEHTRFWEDRWVGDATLSELFPRLFSISMQKEVSVARMRNQNSVGSWDLIWRRRLFEWENNLLQDLLILINSRLVSNAVDRWGWKPEKGEDFTVKSTYSLVSDLFIARGEISIGRQAVFKSIWKCSAPSKVAGFVWLVLLDRVPTRVNLRRRQIVLGEGNYCCPFCGEDEETTVHLFVYCKCVVQVWRQIFDWLTLVFMLPHSIMSLLSLPIAVVSLKSLRQGLVLIWNAVFWCVWRLRNKIIFDNGVFDLNGLVDDIKLVSWKWWTSKSQVPKCLLYEWIREPVICLKR
jgi:hypothetical protein